MVQSKVARILKFCLFEISYVSTPSIHNIFNSTINSSKKTSKYYFGLPGPGMMAVRNMYSSFIHILGGRLYTVRMTGHDEYYCPDWPNG